MNIYLVACLEATESVVSLLLPLAAVQRRRVVAHPIETLGQDVGPLLLVDKDDDGRVDALLQDLMK